MPLLRIGMILKVMLNYCSTDAVISLNVRFVAAFFTTEFMLYNCSIEMFTVVKIFTFAKTAIPKATIV